MTFGVLLMASSMTTAVCLASTVRRRGRWRAAVWGRRLRRVYRCGLRAAALLAAALANVADEIVVGFIVWSPGWSTRHISATRTIATAASFTLTAATAISASLRRASRSNAYQDHNDHDDDDSENWRCVCVHLANLVLFLLYFIYFIFKSIPKFYNSKTTIRQ